MKRAKRYAFVHKIRYWTKQSPEYYKRPGRDGWPVRRADRMDSIIGIRGSSLILAALLDQKVQLTDSRIIQADSGWKITLESILSARIRGNKISILGFPL